MVGFCMKSIKKILLVTPGFPDGERDTSCIPALQVFVRRLAKNSSVKVTVVSIHYPFQTGWYEWHDVAVYSFAWANCAVWKKPLLWLQLRAKVLNILGSDFDLVHSFWLGEASMLGSFLAGKINCPHLLTYMGQDVLPSNRYRHIASWNGVDEEVLLTQNHLDSYKKNIKESDRLIIPWGIDSVDFEHINSNEKTFDVIGLGSLITLKRYDDFLHIVGIVKNRFPNVRVALVGDGVEMKNLKELSHSLNLGDNVQFLGALPREEALSVLASSKVLLHPSIYESFGYIFQEAIFSDVRIVSRAVGSAESESFWRISESVDDLAKDLLFFLGNTAQSFSENAQMVSETCKAYLAVYDKLIQENA